MRRNGAAHAAGGKGRSGGKVSFSYSYAFWTKDARTDLLVDRIQEVEPIWTKVERLLFVKAFAELRGSLPSLLFK
jgi:hypothetical protein